MPSLRTRPTTRRGGVATVLALVLLAVFSPPAPASDGPTLQLTPSSGTAGSAVEAAGEGFPAGFEAILRLDDPQEGPVLGEDVPITSDGSFRTTFVVPRGVAPGDHLVHVCVRRSDSTAPVCDRMPTARFRVTDPTSAPTSAPPRSTTPAPPVEPPPTAPGGLAVTPPTTAPPDTELAVPTTILPPSGVGDLAGPTTTHGLGLGELQGAAELPDLMITGTEITQGIQNLDNDMPLVADRTTVLRVYVQTDGETVPHVSGLLQLVRNGTDEVAVIAPDNGPLTVGGDAPDRLDVDGSLNFTLPPEATGATSQGDKLIATAFVFSTHPSTPAELEPTDVNNFQADVHELHTVGNLTVHLLPMHMHELPDPDAPDATYLTSPTDLFALAATMASLYRYHPVAGVTAVMGPTVYPPLHGLDVAYDWFQTTSAEWDLTLDGVEASILAQVQAVWAESTPSSSHLDQYYGVYREDLPREWGGFSNGTVAYGYYDLAFGDVKKWYHRAGWLAGHELGHSIGFDHVACSGSEENPGEYPWSDPCTLGPVDPAGFYGWDIRHDAFAVTDGPTVISQAPGLHDHNAYPYMGYEGAKWADPWHYCRALEKLGVDCTALDIPENDAEIGPTEGPDLTATQPYLPKGEHDGWVEVIAVSHPTAQGQPTDHDALTAARFEITIDGTAAAGGVVPEYSFELAWPKKAGAAPTIVDVRTVEPLPHVLDAMAERRAEAAPTGVVAVVVDAAGQVLAELELVDDMHGADPVQADGEAAEPGAFVAGTSDYLPWFDEAVAVQLRVGDTVVSERRASANAPTLSVVAPGGGDLVAPFDVVWDAADADGDDLAFDVAYSADGGATWIALAHYLSGSTYTVPDTSLLAGGDQATFRVTARDGLHATSATSAPARLADQPPQVFVLSPADTSMVPQHGSITLLASATDAEDADSPAVMWTSDRDGRLGTGSQLVTQALSAGDHVLTATATDSIGGTASASVVITVDAASALPRLDEAGFEAGVRALRAGPVQLADLEPAASGGRSVAWGAAALTVVALLAAGGAVRRARAARRNP